MASTPSRIVKTLAPKTLRERWNNYLNNGFSGEDIDYWNNEAIEIEKALPFGSQAEHDKWSNMAATWTGEPEWELLTQKLLNRHERYGFDPENTAMLNNYGYKGKDYDEAMRRYMGGEGVGDILSGLITQEDYEYDDVDDDYTRSYGPVDNPGKYKSYLKWKENN